MEANNTANNGKKNIVNTTVVRGFVATEPKVSNFAETSVIRFALAVRNRTTKKATGEVTSQSSLITVEKWAKNTNLSSFNAIRKGILVEVKGMLKPNEWTGNDGVHLNCIITVACEVKEIPRPSRQLDTAASAVA